LFNHVYFSELPESYKKALLVQRKYLKIVDHPNYSPRIVDMKTDFSRVRDLEPSQYATRFLRSLDNPLEIWQRAFAHQLSQGARNLLLVLASMPGEVFLEDLNEAFQAFQSQFSREFQQPFSPRDFPIALKELDDNFTRSERPDQRIIISFHRTAAA
jgi:hypothetical protein